MTKIGLTSEEAAQSLQRYGNNALSKPPQQTFFDKLLDNFQDPIIRILIVALLINVVFVYMGYADWIETVGIFVAIILATFVSTLSEYSNENAFQKLQEEASRITCKVWRDGKPVELRIDDIVVGDAVQLESGDKVPVDGLLLEGSLKLDQAALNGESEEAKKKPASPDFSWGTETDFLNPYCLYRGSVVVEGQGLMRAEKVGDASVYGQLVQELKEVERDSPLKLKLKHLADKISYFGYAGGLLIFIAVLLHKMFLAGGWSLYIANTAQVLSDVVQALILAVIIIVMAVPEGLPLMIAIVSSLNMRKMLNDHVLVRKLNGIETAGSLNLLFTDKTGTITKGQLEVVDFITGDLKEYAAFDQLPVPIREMAYENVVLNTSAAVAEGAIVGGNITERALTRYIGDYRKLQMPLRNTFVPFNSATKYSFAGVQGASEYTLAKGAPEKLLQYCDYYWDDKGHCLPFTEAMKQSLDEKMVELAGRAIRMLALCTFPKAVYGPELPQKGMALTGILAIRDEVRPEAVEAIKRVHEAGVQIVMITGDRKETAVAIARDAGLLQRPEEQVWTSQELATMTDEEVKRNLPFLRVVSRALPLDKLRLVSIAQEMNLVTGMTGDGVNDSPALKRADVGFAMGSGTEVAKEAGDITILDDNFSSIEKAILYGRTMFKSIRKFLIFQLTVNVAAVLTCFIGPLLGENVVMTVIQLLLINLAMDTLAAIAFGSEPARPEYMREPPVPRSASIVSKDMLIQIVISALYITCLCLSILFFPPLRALFGDVDTTYLKSALFATFMMSITFNGFNARTEHLNPFHEIGRNRNFLLVMGSIFALQFVFVTFGGAALSVEPLSAASWLLCAFLSFLVIPIDVVRKLVTGKHA